MYVNYYDRKVKLEGRENGYNLTVEMETGVGKTYTYIKTMAANSNVKYDLIGKLLDETGLTRKAFVAILKGIQVSVFNQFKDNPEEFIVKAAALINDEKATAVIEHITYNILDDHYDTDVFYIATPVGHYNPDWAIAFYEGTVKHIYFVAETKGSMSSMQLRLIEQSKIHCAREHFKAISGDNVVYDVVDSYQSLLEKVMR